LRTLIRFVSKACSIPARIFLGPRLSTDTIK
jgi:hypothetical protein